MDMKSVFSMRLWSVVLAAAGLFTSPLSATLTVKAATQCARESGADGVRTGVNARESGADGVRTALSAAEGSADGVGARKAATRSGSYPWEGKDAVEVGDAVALSSALGNDGNKGKVIRLKDVISVEADITSSIDASIDLNGYALNFPDVHSSINVTGGCLNIYDGSGETPSIDVNEDNTKAFVVSDGATLNIYAGVFTGGGKSTAIYNAGAVNVYGGTFSKFKRAIDNVGTLTIEGGNFVGKGGVTGIYNRNVATVSGGTFKTYVMGIYNAGTLKLQALPTFGTGNDANATADIGLKAGKVITMAGEISSLPEDYVKIKVGQFSYSESGGYSAAGSVPYMLTSGYKDKVKGIHPAMMFQAYDDVPADYENYEVCAKSGSGTDVGEAQVVKVGEFDAAIFIDGSQGVTFDLQFCVLQFPENANNAVIKLLRNVDLSGGNIAVDNGSAAKPVVIDLNGHLLTTSSSYGVIYVSDGAGLTIRDSGSGGAIVNTNIGRGIGIKNDDGTLTVEGGSISAEDKAIDNSSGMLTVTGGTFTGRENAVNNDFNGTATISGGTFIQEKVGNSPIHNEGTMELGCDAGAVTVLGTGTLYAVKNVGALTVGKNVSITSGKAAGIYNPGTLTVKGFPTFDVNNACDIILFQASDNTNTFISFNADISGVPANPIKIKIVDSGGNPVTPGTSGLTLTSGYAAHVKRGGSGADKDRPRDPGLVFTVLGVADGTYLLLSGGEAVAYAGSFPVAEVTTGGGTYVYNIGTGALGLSTAAGALVQAVYAADRVDDDTTVKMLCDVDLGTAWLDFRTFTSAVGYTPENAKKMTLDLNGFELSGCQIKVIDNSVYSLTVVNTGTDGGILQYGADGVCIANYGELTVKGVTLRATGVSGNRIYNFGTLTIDGEMKFLGSVDANDVYLAYGKTLGIGESLNLSAKLKVYVEDATNVPRKLTTGYGMTVRTPATESTPSKVKAPDEVFTVTNIGSNKLAFAGGEAWVVASGTKALAQTGTTVKAYTDVYALVSDPNVMFENATVMLTDNVNMVDFCLDFDVAGKSFTLDLGGHEISSNFRNTIYVQNSALLDIIDTGGNGCIKNSCDYGFPILNYYSVVSIEGGIKLESTGYKGYGIYSVFGSLTLKGWPTFVHGSDDAYDIYLNQNDVITFTDGITAAPKDKISVQIYGDNLGTITSGYGAHVKYPAGHTKEGEPIDPEEVFTYKPAGTLVAKVHPRLIDVNGAAEAEFWMPHQMVAYVDADGNLHDDLTDSTPQTTDDGHDAYILDGTETTLGADGTDTWYVALPSLKPHYDTYYTHLYPIELKGDVHLVLANGSEMSVGGCAAEGCIHGDASTSLTIYAQSVLDDIGYLSTNPLVSGAAGIRAGTVTINGGYVYLSSMSSSYTYGIYADGGGMTFNGGYVYSYEKYGVFANDCGITVNGGWLTILQEYNTDYGIYCQTTGAHTIDINGGTVSAEGDKAGIWATNAVNIKSDVSAVGTGIGSYAIYSDAGDINISGGKVTADASNPGYYGIYANAGNVSITAGQVKANGTLSGIYAKNDIFLSLSDATEFISSNQYSVESGGVKIPRGQYLGVSDLGCVLNEACGSADADYVFDVPGNTTLSYISGKTLKKAYPVAGSGKYMACDRTDGYWLLGDETVALYPTGVKFIEKLDGTITAEVILSETPLAGVPKDRAVILASATEGNDLGTFALTCANESSGDGITSSNIRDDYDSRTDRLPNFIATDGAKTFAELIGEAAGATVSTAEQARDYLVFTLTGDRFVPITFAYDDTPAAGHCLLVIPKINILLHEDIPAPTGGSSSGARRISLGGGESAATGVNGVIGVGEAKDDTYFGLDGRRLSGRPSQKGVYIRGGKNKKYLFRDTTYGKKL